MNDKYEKFLGDQKRALLVKRFNAQRFGYVLTVGALLGIQNIVFSFVHS